MSLLRNLANQVELWRWRLRDDIGRLHTTRYAMSETDAMEMDPLAERLPWSLEVRMVPENEDEHQALATSAFLRPHF